MEERDQHIAVDLEVVARGLLGERLVDARLPIDQGSIDVKGDEGDVLWNRHGAGIMPCRSLSARCATRLGVLGACCGCFRLESRAAWIYSSTKASNCSPDTG